MSYLDRMHTEHAELQERIQKLSEFFMKEEFDALPHEERVSLQNQHTAMVRYEKELGSRIYRAEAE